MRAEKSRVVLEGVYAQACTCTVPTRDALSRISHTSIDGPGVTADRSTLDCLPRLTVHWTLDCLSRLTVRAHKKANEPQPAIFMHGV